MIVCLPDQMRAGGRSALRGAKKKKSASSDTDPYCVGRERCTPDSILTNIAVTLVPGSSSGGGGSGGGGGGSGSLPIPAFCI